jgi:hypothetical protein
MSIAHQFLKRDIITFYSGETETMAWVQFQYLKIEWRKRYWTYWIYLVNSICQVFNRGWLLC